MGVSKMKLFLFVFFVMSVRSANCHCKNFSLLESSLLNDPENLEWLTSEFFPTDSPVRTIVDIKYVVASTYAEEGEAFADAEKKHLTSDDDDSMHRLGRVLKGYEEIEFFPQQNTLHFRWLDSSINMFVDPAILNKLSLYTFQPEIGNITFYLETECELPSNDELTCNETIDEKYALIELLNRLTSNVSLI